MKQTSPVKRVRTLPGPTRLVLFVLAGGRCEFNGCNQYLLEHELTTQRCIVAEAAHIVAFNEGGARGKTLPRPEDIHDVSNLMLLCHDCHKLIDDHPEIYTVSVLEEYKKAHEERIRHVTGLGPDLKTTIMQLKANIRDQSVAIPAAHVTDAVAPRYPRDTRGFVIDLTGLPDLSNSAYLETATSAIKIQLEKFYLPGMDVESTRHISLFALAPIPLLIYLGSRLSNKIPVDLYQLHRDTHNWTWKTTGEPVDYELKSLRSGTEKSKVALLLSLSGQIQDETLPSDIDDTFSVYELTLKGQVPHPNFLQTKQDLINFRAAYQLVLRTILARHGNLAAIHLFPAVPAPVAVACGYELLPKVDPSLWVYDNDKAHGGFTLALRINDHD
jgi:hypothetical protein